MRPRGESISSRSSRYVGQAFKHNPQCTQRSRSACCGLSDSAIQPAGIEEPPRIEQLLNLFHDRKVIAGSRFPERSALPQFRRRELDHALAERQLGILKVAVAD